MSILPTFFDRGGLSNHDKTTCFGNVDANKYLLQQRYEVHVHMLCSWSWCMLDAMRLEWCSFIVYDWLSCASTRKKKGNNGDPNLETRSVRFVKHWPSNQQWATSLIKLNLCRCLCPYIRVYRCRHECTYMRTCVCMYIYIYIHSCMWMLTHVIRVLCNTSSCEPICNMCNIENSMRWEPIGSCWSFFTIGLPSATCAYVK